MDKHRYVAQLRPLALFWNFVTAGNPTSDMAATPRAIAGFTLRTAGARFSPGRLLQCWRNGNPGRGIGADGFRSAGIRCDAGLPACGGPVARTPSGNRRCRARIPSSRRYRQSCGLYHVLRLSWFLTGDLTSSTRTICGRTCWEFRRHVWLEFLRLFPVDAISRISTGTKASAEFGCGGSRIYLAQSVTNATPIRDALIAEDGFRPGQSACNSQWSGHRKIQIGPHNDRVRLFPGAGDGKLIVLVGNMHSDVKGHPWLIASAPAVVREFPSTRFVLVGDGEQRAGFEKQAADLGLKDNFLFLGRRADVPEILACCDIAVLPSRAEGLPNAVLEYMAAGLACDREPGRRKCRTGPGWRHRTTRASSGLSSALERTVKASAGTWPGATAGASRHEFTVRNFSFERLVLEVDALYSELLQRKGRVASRWQILPNGDVSSVELSRCRARNWLTACGSIERSRRPLALSKRKQFLGRSARRIGGSIGPFLLHDRGNSRIDC